MKEAHPPLFTGNLCWACHVLRPLDLPERHSSAQLCLPPTGKLRLRNAVRLADATQLGHGDPSATPLTQQRGLHQAGPVPAARARAQEPGCPAGVASGRRWVQGWCGRGGLNSPLPSGGSVHASVSLSAQHGQDRAPRREQEDRPHMSLMPGGALQPTEDSFHSLEAGSQDARPCSG